MSLLSTSPSLFTIAEKSYEEQFELILKGWDWGDEIPQVKLFVELLGTLDANNPSMIELGCAGIHSCAYSLLFEKKFKAKGTLICTEPRLSLLNDFINTFRGKHLINAKFYHGYNGELILVSMDPTEEITSSPRLYINNLMKENNINKLDIFHADIQGSETSVLKELISTNIINSIRYFFINLHGTHKEVEELLTNNVKKIKFYYNSPNTGGCGDGLIIAENLRY